MKCSTIRKEIILAHYLANTDMGVKYPSRQLRRPIPIKDSDIVYAGKSLSDLFEESRQEAIQVSTSVVVRKDEIKVVLTLLTRIRL